MIRKIQQPEEWGNILAALHFLFFTFNATFMVSNDFKESLSGLSRFDWIYTVAALYGVYIDSGETSLRPTGPESRKNCDALTTVLAMLFAMSKSCAVFLLQDDTNFGVEDAV